MTRGELLRLGLGPEAIRSWLRTGRLIRVHAGVYAVGHLPTLPLDRAHGALLACGEDAVLSHSSAATAWTVDKLWRMPFEVTVPTRRSRPGIRVHRAMLRREDIRTQLGLRVTSAARTILDLAPRLTSRALERAIDDMRVAGYLRSEQLVEVADRYPRHRGVGAVREITGEQRGPTRSDLELDFVAFVKRYGLPMPLINTKVGRYEVDMLFERERVIVELDGWGYHSSRSSFRGDRRRDAELLALGYLTVRITFERLVSEPDVVANELRTILERQRRLLRSAS